MPARSGEAFECRPLGGQFVEMIGLRIEFNREALDVFARYNFFRAFEAHAQSKIVKPLDHQRFSKRYLLRLSSNPLAHSAKQRSADSTASHYLPRFVDDRLWRRASIEFQRADARSIKHRVGRTHVDMK